MVHARDRQWIENRRGDAERAGVLESLGKLYTLGFPVAWERIAPSGRLLTLPKF